MRLRVPRTALLFMAIGAAIGITILLTARSSSSPPQSPTPTIGLSHSRTCATTRATAVVTARSAIVITVTGRVPVTVTEQATGPKGTATVQRSGVVSAPVRGSQPVSVSRSATATGRGCGAGESPTVAHELALRQAYDRGLKVAHARANKRASQALSAELHRLYPSVLARTRASASNRAHQLAVKSEAALEAQAKREAIKRADG